MFLNQSKNILWSDWLTRFLRSIAASYKVTMKTKLNFLQGLSRLSEEMKLKRGRKDLSWEWFGCPHKVKGRQRFNNQAQLCLPFIILTLLAKSSGLQTYTQTDAHRYSLSSQWKHPCIHYSTTMAFVFSLYLSLCISHSCISKYWGLLLALAMIFYPNIASSALFPHLPLWKKLKLDL